MAKTAKELGIKGSGFQDNAWIDGYNYDAATGTFGDVRGQIWSQNNPAARGSMVSNEVNAQSAAAQGKSVPEFNAYLKGNSTLSANAARNAGTSGGGGGTGSGAPSLSGGGGSNTGYNVTEEYDKLAKELGIADLKTGVDTKAAEITARRERLAAAQATINENPFYAEATRVGKGRRLDESAQADITNLEREQALAQAKVDEANQQLGTKTNLSVQQYNIDRQERQDAVGELNTLLSAKTNLSGINVDEFAAKTGMSSGTIQALVAASQAKEIKPTVVQSTNDAGVVTVTIIDQNTGAIVGQQNLGAIGNKENSGAGKAATEGEITRYYTDTLRNAVRSGLGVRDVFAEFQGNLDPNQIIQIYNANSPHGVAKETPEELASLGVTSYYGQ